MDRDAEEEVIRRAYAMQIMAACGISDQRIETAFASVKREHFLGRGPWQIVRWGRGYMPTPSRNPVYLYDDVVVAIIPDRHLNNGQPSLHAMLIASAAPKMGEHAVHIGAGVGYYTAILHRLVGRSGRVTAIEFDTGLAARLAANFGGVRNVNTVQGDGSRVAFDSADIIYVNAGATKPAEAWLDRLTEAGRLILPMTASEFPGVMYSRARYFASSVEATIFSPGAFPQWRSFLVRGCATRNPKPRSRLPSRKAGHKR